MVGGGVTQEDEAGGQLGSPMSGGAWLQPPEGGQEPFWVSLRRGRARAEGRLQGGLGQHVCGCHELDQDARGRVGTSSPRSRAAEHIFLHLSVQA